MEELIKMMTNPFSEIEKGDKVVFWNNCSKIAKEMFCKYCILCDGIEYYFSEIEFYYFEKGKWEEDWNKITYARDDYKAGTLFYHLSGVDICFDSYYNNNRFGGILIRSVKCEDGTLITGPLNCKDLLLNSCKGGSNKPQLSRRKISSETMPKSTKRLLGKTDMKKNIDGSLELCFYDGTIQSWDTQRDWYDKNKGEIRSRENIYNRKKLKCYR